MRFRTAVLGFVALAALVASYAAANEFSVNVHRHDPYKRYKFRVKWDGKYVPGVMFVSGLTRTTEVATYRKGNEASGMTHTPGPTTYAPIILERGRTHDDAFETWVNKVWNFGAGLGSESSLADYRKDIMIELYNEAGQLAMAWKVYNCWPSKYSAVTEFDAASPDLAIESLTLEHDGWERDTAVAEPTEPTYTTP
ncbi:MAG: phage tail protein [Candidatus Eisenbacteria bacterium]